MPGTRNGLGVTMTRHTVPISFTVYPLIPLEASFHQTIPYYFRPHDSVFSELFQHLQPLLFNLTINYYFILLVSVPD